MTNYHPTAAQFSTLRRDIETIRKATAAGSTNFEMHARLHNSPIFSCSYNQIGQIISDTMAGRFGRTILIEQNLQYYPAKVRFYFANGQHPVERVTVGRGVTKGDLMRLAYKGNTFNVDTAIPEEYYKRLKGKSFWHVMDYNGRFGAFGCLRDLREVAASNYINITKDYTKEGIIRHPQPTTV